MAILTILEFPDPRLRKKAVPVETVDAPLRALIDDMFETMYAAPGIGLAATQVDVHRRLLVADVSSEKDDPHVFINPEVLEKDGVTVTEEGCLSVPGYFEEVERAEHIKVRYLDRDGAERVEEFEGLLAVLRAARDRSPRRQVVCRLPVGGQAATDSQKAREGTSSPGHRACFEPDSQVSEEIQ